ncbi:unnamed protein product, partial [Dicrocoelium dendriticum]
MVVVTSTPLGSGSPRATLGTNGVDGSVTNPVPMLEGSSAGWSNSSNRKSCNVVLHWRYSLSGTSSRHHLRAFCCGHPNQSHCVRQHQCRSDRVPLRPTQWVSRYARSYSDRAMCDCHNLRSLALSSKIYGCAGQPFE